MTCAAELGHGGRDNKEVTKNDMTNVTRGVSAAGDTLVRLAVARRQRKHATEQRTKCLQEGHHQKKQFFFQATSHGTQLRSWDTVQVSPVEPLPCPQLMRTLAPAGKLSN